MLCTFLFSYTFCIFVIEMLSVVNGFGMNLMKVDSEDRSQIACTVGLLRKYFHSGETLSGSLLSVSMSSASLAIQQNLMRAIHLSEESWTITVRNGHMETSNEEFNSTEGSNIIYEKPQCYFVVIENLENDDLESIFDDWKLTLNWNPLAQFVVFLASVEESDEEMTELMIEILLSFLNKKVFNVNVIGQNEENGYFYGKTVFPYHTDNNCGNRVITIETLDICDYQDRDEDNDGDEENYEDDDSEESEDSGTEEENTSDEVNNNESEQMAENRQYSEPQEKLNYENNYKTIDSKEDLTEEKSEEFHDSTEKSEESDRKKDDTNKDISADGSKENTNIPEENTSHRNYTENENANEDISAEKSKEYEYVEKPEEIPSNDNNNKSDGADEVVSTENEDKPDQFTEEPNANSNGENNNGNTDFSGENGDKIEENTIDDNNSKNGNENEDISNEKSEEFLQKPERNPSDENNSKSNEANDNLSAENEDKPEENTADKNDSKIDDGNGDTSPEKSKETTEKPEGGQPGTDNKREEVKVYMEELYRALFTDKFPQDLSGCSLIAAFRPWEPYIFNEVPESTNTANDLSDVLEPDSEINNMDGDGFDIAYTNYDSESDDGGNSSETSQNRVKLSGIEYMMVQTIGERLHINIEMRIENKNLYHLFQLLMDGDIEMIIGGIDEDPSISQYVSSTIPYHQDDLTWCVAKAKRHYSLFNFLQSFEKGTWTLTIAFIFVTTFQILLIQRLLNIKSWSMRSFTAISLRVMGIVLSQSIQLRSTTLALKITFFTAFFMGLMFSNVYQSFLVSTLTTPRSLNQIKRLTDLYEHRMSVMGSVDNVRHISKEDKIFKYIRENFQMCYNIEECLQRAAQNEHIAVAVSRQHSYYNPRIPRDHLYCFDRNENLYVYLVTMLLPKKYHLLHKINPIIQYIIESGHMQKWARDLDIKRKIRDEINRVREDAFRSLTLVQVAGGFAFSGILLLFATGIFFLELYTYRMYIIKRTRIKILRIFHTNFQKV